MPLRRADGPRQELNGIEGVPRPRVLPLLGLIAVFAVAVAYCGPAITTGDPLWPLPADTHASTLVVYWDGARRDVVTEDPSYRPLMTAVNQALSSPQGIDYRYGLPATAFENARQAGRALEALYPSPQRAHGAYAQGMFTRLFVFLSGEEFDRGLVFVGDPSAYRSGPLRARDLGPLRDLAEHSK